MLWFLRQNLKTGPCKTKERACKAMIRPFLVYASSVWDPHTKRASQWLKWSITELLASLSTSTVCNTSSVEEMLEILEWLTLQQQAARLTMLYKITNGLACVKCLDLTLQPSSGSSGHNLKYQRTQYRTDYWSNAFFRCTINTWKKLSPEVARPSFPLNKNCKTESTYHPSLTFRLQYRTLAPKLVDVATLQ